MIKFYLAGILFLFSVSCANNISKQDIPIFEDAQELDIPILFNVSKNTFPIDWQTTEINAQGISLDSSECKRTLKIIKEALEKYPKEVLEKNLIKVFVLKSIKFYDVHYGGTNSNDIVYITNNGISEGYTNEYIEKTFHHEFSSILLRNYPNFFPLEKWEAINDLKYQDESGGVESIRLNLASTDFNEKLMKKGFLYEYALSGFENDLNSFAENIFLQNEDFKRFVSKYSKISQKQKLIYDFYVKINESFSSEFFENIRQK